MTQLRVISEADGAAPVSFADACRSTLEAVLAKGALAIVILYETSGAIERCSVPPLESIERGMVETVHDEFAGGGAA